MVTVWRPAEGLRRGGIEIETEGIRGGGRRGGRGGGDGGGSGTDRQRIFAIVTVVRARGPPLHSHNGRRRECRQRPCLSRMLVGGRGVVGVDRWRARMCTAGLDGGRVVVVISLRRWLGRYGCGTVSKDGKCESKAQARRPDRRDVGLGLGVTAGRRRPGRRPEQDGRQVYRAPSRDVPWVLAGLAGPGN